MEKQTGEEVELAARRIEEINVELEQVICQLGEAKVERHESSRAVKKQELIENLKRLFPGVVRISFFSNECMFYFPLFTSRLSHFSEWTFAGNVSTLSQALPDCHHKSARQIHGRHRV